MSFFYTPNIGDHGVFMLSAPLTGVLTANTEYICRAIRCVSDYFASNEDKFLLQSYTQMGLTEADLDADRTEDARIISLQSAVGHWAYIPERYFTQPSIVNGVPYTGRSVTVFLPAMPVSTDLTPLKNHFIDYVRSTFGVTATAKVVKTTKTVQVEQGVHTATTAQRELNKGNSGTDYQRFKEKEAQYNALLAKYEELMTFTTAQLTP